jgi:hypothetical protein
MDFTRLEHFIIDWIGVLTFIMFILLFVGILQKEPTFFVEFVFLFKVGISLFLIYRFNKFRKDIKFTELDRKVCFAAGVNILLISFADLIQEYTKKIKDYLNTSTLSITEFR